MRKLQGIANVCLVLGAVLAASLPGRATTFVEQEFTCPIGGERFEAPVVGSNSTFGERPDGRPYSPLPVVPMTECADNGFLFYQETFSEEEIAQLEPLVLSETYQSMRDSDTQYYRLWWLLAKLDGDRASLAQIVMIAGWETDNDPARKARYQQAFVEAVAALDDSPDTPERFWLSLRAANAMRELGQFDASQALLGRLEGKADILDDKEERKFARRLIDGLNALDAERVRAPDPANLVPAFAAPRRCVAEKAALASVEQKWCAQQEVRDAIASVEIVTEDGRTLEGEPAILYLVEHGQPES